MKNLILLFGFFIISQIATASSHIDSGGTPTFNFYTEDDPQLVITPTSSIPHSTFPMEDSSLSPSLSPSSPILTLKDLSDLLEGKTLSGSWEGWQFEGLNSLRGWLSGGSISAGPFRNDTAILNQAIFKGSAEFWNFPFFCLNKKPVELTFDNPRYKFYKKFSDPVQCVGKSGFLFRFFPAILGRSGPAEGIDVIAYRPTLPTDNNIPPYDNLNDLTQYFHSLEGHTILSMPDSTRDSVQYWKNYLENLGKKSTLNLSNSHLENKHLFALSIALLGNRIIKNINLAGNNITHIPTILGYNLPHFQELIISNNPIAEWPLGLGRNWGSMQRIIANQLNISKLSYDFAIYWPKLRTLHFSYGNLEMAPSIIESDYGTFKRYWPYLTQLNLTHNKLSLASQLSLTSLKKGFRKEICKISFGDQELAELEDPSTL